METHAKVEVKEAKQEPASRSRIPRFTTILLVVLALGLVISLLVNVWLYRSLGAFADRIRDGRGDLASVDKYAEENDALGPLDPNTVRMVFAGDSDIELWEPLPEVENAQMVQRGIGGDRSGDLLLRLDRDVIDLKPSCVVMTIGGNDLEDLAQFPDQEEAIVEICKHNIQRIVERLRQHQVHVVLLTVLPYGEVDLDHQALWSNATYDAVNQVNAMIRTMNAPGVTVVDCDPILALANGRRKPEYSAEMVHLNPAGYQALNEGLQPVLESLVPSLLSPK